jgi:hypothetical protein
MTTQSEPRKLAIWAVVQIMGHQMVAGYVTEEPVAGTNMLRVDVPAVDEWPAHTKYFGGGAIYSIDPCTEEIAKQAAAGLAARYGYTPMPVHIPKLDEASRVIRDARSARQPQLPAGRESSFEADFDTDDDDPTF